jgi:hypothetical protein
MRYLVIGGEVVDVNAPIPVFKTTPAVVGFFAEPQHAKDAWKAASWSNVDNAHARYLILTIDVNSPDFKWNP